MSVESLYTAVSLVSLNPWFLWFAVFFVAFVLEEGAAALAVWLTLSGNLTLAVAVSAVYCGVVVTDLGLYGIGRGARRVQWLRRRIDTAYVQRASDWVGKRLLLAVVVSRLLPWTLPPTFIACGYLALPFNRFVGLAMSTAAIWTVIVFGGLMGLGGLGAEGKHGQLVVWVCAALLLALAYKFIAGKMAERFEQNASIVSQSVWFERLPAIVFYIPVVCIWLWFALKHRSLTLPTAANPGFECGGFVGESKVQAFGQVSEAAMPWFAPQISMVRSKMPLDALEIDRAREASQDAECAVALLAEAGLEFPVVAKPDRGHHGWGVCPVSNVAQLARYLAAFPPGETVVLQQLVTLEHEVGVFYIRLPGAPSGQLFSLNQSLPCRLTGDGRHTLAELIEQMACSTPLKSSLKVLQQGQLDLIPCAGESVPLSFARSHRLGARLLDVRTWATPALLARFDAIADGIAGFHFGRFDVRFSDLDAFQRGQGFQILEINGVGAEANHIWDPKASLRSAYAALYEQYQLAFRIGAMNRSRGFAPIGAVNLWRFFITQHRSLRTFRATGRA